MSERMSATGSNKPASASAEYNSSASSGNELFRFSASEQEELKEKLSCLSPEMMISWLQGFVNAKVQKASQLLHKNPLTSVERNIEDEIQNYGSRSLELRFSKSICSPVFTKENIKGEGCEPLRVSLFDSCTGEEVKTGPGSSERVQIVVLEGDSESDGGDSWTPEEFDKRVVGEVEGKNSLLEGNVCLNMINGTGCVNDVYFKSRSDWMKITCFRLGARLADTSMTMGIRVKEAVTKPFKVKDWRKNLYKSHDIPYLCDEVWRLHKIGRKGPVNKRLVLEDIKTVKDFLDLHFTNAKKLREIFRKSAKNLENALRHARKCPDKLLYYPSAQERKAGVVFNVSGEVLGLVIDDKFASSNMLSETEKDLADNSATRAFQHWGDVILFEDQKYLVRCSNASLTDHESVTPEIIGHCMADINELMSDDILVFNDAFCSPPHNGSEEPQTFESVLENIDEIFICIDAQKQPNVKSISKQTYADIAFSINATYKAYKSWKMYSKSFHLHKKRKLY